MEKSSEQKRATRTKRKWHEFVNRAIYMLTWKEEGEGKRVKCLADSSIEIEIDLS